MKSRPPPSEVLLNGLILFLALATMAIVLGRLVESWVKFQSG